MDLCDENYRHLLRLAPAIRELEGEHVSNLHGAMDLHLTVLEQTPYTTLIRLTYYFSRDSDRKPDPDARLRVYHDSCQVEVLELEQSALPLNNGLQRPTLGQKWRVNLFLSKWLSFCVGQGHCFGGDARSTDSRLGVTESC
ncbi:MAG TPA: DUF1249 domain-containing protein [Sedimenticola sp.]|nr:DUF1249 domain-containing protein [Sedimenticola sp.]